jgi:hypothetical protein
MGSLINFTNWTLKASCAIVLERLGYADRKGNSHDCPALFQISWINKWSLYEINT